MTLDLKLVEAFVIEHTEFRCQAAKCPYEPELRADAIYNETKPDVCRELKTGLGFALHLSQRVSRGEQVRVQGVAAVCGIRKIADSVGGGEAATVEFSRFLDVFRPWDD